MTTTAPSTSDGNLLLIGFSFGLTPDGSPGACNFAIAQRVLDGIACYPQAKVGMQWEIFDALKEIAPRFDTSTFTVAPPFRRAPTEGTTAFREELALLEGSRFQPKRLLAKLVRVSLLEGSSEASPNEIDVVLEALWKNRGWWTNFVGLIDFEDLRRPDKDLLGLEKRCMPAGRDYPGGVLREYQAMRVNRLILETILPPQVLPRAEYLNTRKVAEFVKSHDETRFQTIVAYAHPQHFGWCGRNVRAVWGDVELRKGWAGDEIWDPLSAQIWTRSPENYATYNSI